MIFKKRFGRRKQSIACTDKVFCQFFDVDPKIIEKARKHSRLEVALIGNKITIVAPSVSEL